MFLKLQILKKLMKEAFKHERLIVAQNEDTFYIGGRYWEVEIEKTYIQKTILAEMIELTGEIPLNGECFLAGKSGNQMQVWETEINPEGIDQELEVTDLILLTKSGLEQRVLQDPISKTVILLDNTFMNLIDKSQVDHARGEHPPIGPYYNQKREVLWYSNSGKVRLMHRKDDEHQNMLKDMEMLDLWE